MPAVEMEPPRIGTYSYVMRRLDKEHDYPAVEYAYDETVTARSVVWPDVGRACTVFVRETTTRDFLAKQGWIDESHRWTLSLGAPAPVVTPPRQVGKPPVQRIR